MGACVFGMAQQDSCRIFGAKSCVSFWVGSNELGHVFHDSCFFWRRLLIPDGSVECEDHYRGPLDQRGWLQQWRGR